MTDDDKPNLVALRRRREEVIQVLSDRFSSDVLDVDEFEDRVGLAHRATNTAALDELVADLEEVRDARQSAPATELVAPRVSDEERALIAANRADSKNVIAIIGSVERGGNWRVPHKVRVFTLIGRARLDFREVELPPGTTEVSVYSVIGGVEIVVPPSLAVECDGVGIIGGFENLDRAPVIPDPDKPLLRIAGLTILGGCEVSTRLPGESARQAKRRRKKELKAKRREQRKLAAREK